MSRSQEQQVVAGFEKAYAASAPGASWLGVPVTTSPLDLWVYQEIVHETHPDLIVAVDTSGTAYLADLCAMVGRGEVLAIDSAPPSSSTSVAHPRIRSLLGSSVAPDTLREAAERARRAEAVMVVLGSRSAGGGALAQQLDGYGPLTSVGGYLIVEDTTGTGERSDQLQAFLREHPSFAADRTREKLLMTGNVGGYLKRLL